MKTGIELIAKERDEQINVHGRTVESDRENNKNGQFISAIRELIEPYSDRTHPAVSCPHGWDEDQWRRMIKKTHAQRLVIAGALIAAELDRIDVTGKRILDLFVIGKEYEHIEYQKPIYAKAKNMTSRELICTCEGDEIRIPEKDIAEGKVKPINIS